MAPGSSRMETPAMLCETGNSSAVASFADPPGPTQCVCFSMSYLKLRSSSTFSFSASAALARFEGREVAARPREVSETAPNIPRRLSPGCKSFDSSGMSVSLNVQSLNSNTADPDPKVDLMGRPGRGSRRAFEVGINPAEPGLCMNHILRGLGQLNKDIALAGLRINV